MDLDVTVSLVILDKIVKLPLILVILCHVKMEALAQVMDNSLLAVVLLDTLEPLAMKVCWCKVKLMLSPFFLVCPPNMFGIDCAMTCSCNGGFCDPVDGTCVCLSGFIGSNCIDSKLFQVQKLTRSTNYFITVCPEGTFGDNCEQECQCQNGANCNHVDGTCVCSAGYMGTTCSDR